MRSRTTDGLSLLSALSILIALFAVSCTGGETSAPAEPTEGDAEYAQKMSEEHKDDTPQASPAVGAEPRQAVVTEEVVYATLDGVEIKGYLAQPAEGAEGAPGILVIHEWWGLNDNVRAMARQLAGEGYQALAVDIYSGRVAEEPEDARTFMQEAMATPDAVDDNLRQAHAFLNDRGAPKTGSIGWCFGGGMSLRTALLHPIDLDAAVIYYGRLETDEDTLRPLEMPILGIFGAEDQGIPVDTVRAFETSLKNLGKAAQVHVYEGADHAFANPSGSRYQVEAATDAWGKTLAFFAQNLRGN